MKTGKTWAHAKEFCQGQGLDLPEEEDFDHLRRFMGSRPGTNKGFKSQVLPDLVGRLFWSLSLHRADPGYAYVFYGDGGYIYEHGRDNNYSVRCVSR